jgi:glycosyltransferase involved in cell wall biosynthesis
MAPNRLTIQVDELLRSGADICGVRDLLHYVPMAGQAWLYSYPADMRGWLAGPTLLYRRSAWAARPFPEIQIGEDTRFVWQTDPDRLHAVDDSSFYIAVIHDRNTAAKNLGDPRWRRRPLDDVGRLLVHDRAFYAALRNGGRVAPTPGVAGPTVTVVAPFLVYDGYGSMAEYTVLGMGRVGASVSVIPLTLDPAGLSSELRDLLDDTRPAPDVPVLYYCWPHSALQRFTAARDLFVNTMWESSRLPAGWAAALNQARAVFVPTRFVARVCRESGVTVPIEVVPEGIDPGIYHYEDRPERASPTTLMVGTLIERKHIREGIAAWKLAFADDPGARLIVKAHFNQGVYHPDDPRISVVDSNETSRGIAHWYREADILLALGNEGFGLPLVEGMATGLPVIALNSEGQSDACEDAGDLLLPVEASSWQPCNDPPFGPAGVRGVPGVEAVAERLRWVARHRDEARALGRAASAWAIKHRNIWDKGPALLSAMERYLSSPRPLRRTRMIWTPTWGSDGGLSEYTRSLTAHMPSITVSAQAPDLRGARVLHIQHEPGMFSDDELTRLAQQARASGVPIVVTEHVVAPQAQAWEREASALVATSERGAMMLRARWPGQRVEYIPPGCPAWFPPRKARRGRVVGVVALPGQQNGISGLLGILRDQPGAELVVYSLRGSAVADWETSVRGLPVRHEAAPLPAEEAARRLAQEADILVFWQGGDASPLAGAAVRAGLATGVPVLASPAGWAHDVRHATSQPDDLAEGVRRLLEDTSLRDHLAGAAREFCHAHDWRRIAERHMALWESLEQA